MQLYAEAMVWRATAAECCVGCYSYSGVWLTICVAGLLYSISQVGTVVWLKWDSPGQDGARSIRSLAPVECTHLLNWCCAAATAAAAAAATTGHDEWFSAVIGKVLAGSAGAPGGCPLLRLVLFIPQNISRTQVSLRGLAVCVHM
jgi:hypothetical protein